MNMQERITIATNREQAGSLLHCLHVSRGPTHHYTPNEVAQRLVVLRNIGEEALLECLRIWPTEIKYLRVAVGYGQNGAALVPKLREIFALNPDKPEVSRTIRDAFVAFGSVATPAIPTLIEAFSHDRSNHREDASRALAGIGVAALPEIKNILLNGSFLEKDSALRTILCLGKLAFPLLEALQLMQSISLNNVHKHNIKTAITAVNEWKPQTPERLCIPL